MISIEQKGFILKKRVLFFVLIRSFFIDVLWNYQKFQNIGFLYMILPVIKRLYPNKEKRALAMKRHIKYFRTHPYLATSIAGVVTNMEEKKSNVTNGNFEDIDRIKFNMMGPFAAIGDSFFYQALKPFLAIIAISFMAITSDISIMIFASIFFLIFFNIPHLFIRIAGLIEGYRKGFEAIRELKQLDIQSLVTKIRFIAVIFLGCFIAVVFPASKFEFMGFKILTNFLLLGMTFLYAVLLSLRVSTTVLFAITLIFCIILSYLGINIL